MCFVITYDLTVGPICYCLVAEIPSTRLRITTAVLARNAYKHRQHLRQLPQPAHPQPTGLGSPWQRRLRVVRILLPRFSMVVFPLARAQRIVVGGIGRAF